MSKEVIEIIQYFQYSISFKGSNPRVKTLDWTYFDFLLFQPM